MIPLINVFKILPLWIIVAIQMKNAANAKSAKGNTRFPGKIAASISVMGISTVPMIIVVGWPKVTAESSPIYTSLPEKCLAKNPFAASDRGIP